MKVDPPLGAYLSESEISCPVFNADDLRKPSPGAMARFDFDTIRNHVYVNVLTFAYEFGIDRHYLCTFSFMSV